MFALFQCLLNNATLCSTDCLHNCTFDPSSGPPYVVLLVQAFNKTTHATSHATIAQQRWCERIHFKTHRTEHTRRLVSLQRVILKGLGAKSSQKAILQV